MDNPVIQTVLRNFLTKLATAVLIWIAAYLTSRGIATEDQVHQLVDPLAQVIVGGVLSGLALVVIAIKARLKRERELLIRAAEPAAVVVKGA